MREVNGKQEQGQCPKCKSDDLEYSNGELTDGGFVYDVICNQCNWEGQGWYNLVFSGYYEVEE